MKSKGIEWDTSRQQKTKSLLYEAIHGALLHGVNIATQALLKGRSNKETNTIIRGMIHIYLEDTFESSQAIKETTERRKNEK